jgi:hypothetical protein
MTSLNEMSHNGGNPKKIGTIWKTRKKNQIHLDQRCPTFFYIGQIFWSKSDGWQILRLKT